MPDKQDKTDRPTGQTSKQALVIGLVLAFLGGGAAFSGAYLGLIPVELKDESEPSVADIAPDSDVGQKTFDASGITFVPVTPIILSVGSADNRMQLRFGATLEVKRTAKSEIETLMPRIVDIVNTYLRAMKVSDLEDPTALLRIRAQLLRRVQVVAGDGRINDFLVLEFILN